MTLAAEPLTLRPRSERLKAPLFSVAGLATVTLALHLRDPHAHGSWGLCPLYALTGLYCPGCGGLRGVNDLTDGHVRQALSSNLMLALVIPFVLVALGRWTYGAWTGREISAVPAMPQAVKIGLVVLVVAFTLARNLPGSWLAP
ncbi:MAG TPA: DUF2752 domain-containing protein [Nocardioides sp.]|jgi:hypothetical protein|nr:DUF2752 domain-containing protein [Nocardioides sp.]